MKLSKNELDQITEKIIDDINEIIINKFSDKYGNHYYKENDYNDFINPIFDNLIDRLEYDQNNRD